MTEAQTRYNYWLQHAKDLQVQQQLKQMAGNSVAIENAFFSELQFGTAGLRGIMTAGSNCINIYTIIKASVGVAMYMKEHNFTSAAITYDSRLNSQLYAQNAAAALASFGIKVYITKECMPTPYVSFMIRQLHCDIGINVTASHNPAEYNGYKVYNAFGCQIEQDEADEITDCINKVNPFDIETFSFEKFVANKTVIYTDQALEESYIKTVISQNLGSAAGIKVVYTPLNGAGYRIVPEVLKRVGLNDIEIVPQQAYPDGNFATCPYPNPEKAEAMSFAVQLAKKTKADLVIGNDPDCDRLGVAVKDGKDYKILSGNEVGVLLCDYILSSMQQTGTLPEKPIVVKTIVSTVMADKIAAQYGAEMRDVLTGFKYIGGVINQLEQQGQQQRFIFGFEESCGYLKGSYVRDKDGVVASMLIAVAAAQCKKHGLTLADKLRMLYKEHGNYLQKTISYRFEGAEGADKKQKLLDGLRQNPFTFLGDKKVEQRIDYLTQTQWELPKADVLRYVTEQGASQLIIRPSGTEPLIKAYITVCGDESQNDANFDKIKQQTDNYFK